MKKSFILLVLLLIGRLSFAAWVDKVPQTLRQPDGKTIHCFATGDEFYHWLHDENDFTIVMNPSDGYFYYGIRSGETVVPSRYRAGSVNPARVGLQPGARISEKLYYEKRARAQSGLKSGHDLKIKGTLTSIVIYISFADDSVFSYNRKHFTDMWNSDSLPSVKDYYDQISYGKLNLNPIHFPVSPDSINLCYKDIHRRNYYIPRTADNPEGYNGDEGDRERQMLQRAVEYVRSQIPTNLDLDVNGDGSVDNICFVIRGQSTAWADLLWPHMTGMGWYNVMLNRARVDAYFLTMEQGFGASTMCHELGHVFGAPDLYHYGNSGHSGPDAVGGWCLMCSTADPPQSICGFLKYKYNQWIDSLPEITGSGTYSLRPLTQPTHNLFMIRSAFSRQEYFVLEYRKREGRYETSVPGSGLVVYRINPNAGGNAGGPPDEVYIYRPGGSLTQEGSLNSAAFYAPTRTAINDNTDPYSFLYNFGRGGRGGLDILNVSEAGDSITFDVRIEHFYPPTQLDYTPSDRYVDLSWYSSGALGLATFFIYRNGHLYNQTLDTTWADFDLQMDSTYYYSISAYYRGQFSGESIRTNTVMYTPKPVMNLPYREDFETQGFGWKIKNSVEGFRWGDAAALGMNSLNTTKYLGSNSVASGLQGICSDYAISPRLNLANRNKVYVHFDYTLKRWLKLDHLKVYYRRAPTASWVEIVDLPVSPIGSPYKWKKYNLEIPADAYTAEAQLGFQYDDGNDMGYGAGIDNVLVDEEATSGIETDVSGLSVEVFPNPAVNEAQVSLTGTDGRDLLLKLVGQDGRLFWTKSIRNATDGPVRIGLTGMADGIYHFIAETGEEVIVRSLVKQSH